MNERHHHKPDQGPKFISHEAIFNMLAAAGYTSVRDKSKKTKKTQTHEQAIYPDMKLSRSAERIIFEHASSNQQRVEVPLHAHDQSKNKHVTINEAKAICKRAGTDINELISQMELN